MSSWLVSGFIFACTLLASSFGGWLQGRLPGHHLEHDSKEALKMCLSLLSTLSALVLGLMIASAKSSFDAQQSEVREIAVDLVQLDRALADYGLSTEPTRRELKQVVTEFHRQTWAGERYRIDGLDSPELVEQGRKLEALVRALPADSEEEKITKSRIVGLTADLTRTRWLLSQHPESSIPRPFLFVLAFWLTALFATFALLSRRHATLTVCFFVCSLSVAGALFLIVELDQPFDGLIRVSDAPIRAAISRLGT